MNRIDRRNFIRSLALPALSSFSTLAPSAESKKPLSIYVPAPPGGGTDMTARVLGKAITKHQGRTVIVGNRPGAFGMIAAQGVLRAPPDGNTLLLTHTGAVLLPSMRRNLLVDVTREFQPVSMACTSSNLLIVASRIGVTTVRDYMEWVRERPNGTSVGSFGVGSTSHIDTELLNRVLQGKVTHVPFQGAAPLLHALLGGQVDAGFNERASMLANLKNPAIKVLATTGAERSAVLPDVPTLKELGYQGFEQVGFIAMFAPSRVAPEVVTAISDELQFLYRGEEVRSELLTLGFTPHYASATGLEEIIRRDKPKWESVIRAANIRVE